MRQIASVIVALVGAWVAACSAAPRRMTLLAIAGEKDPDQCFDGDARAIVAVFGSEHSTLLSAPTNEQIHAGIREAEGGALIYYAGHGDLPASGAVREVSEWHMRKDATVIRVADLLGELCRAQWASVVAVGC